MLLFEKNFTRFVPKTRDRPCRSSPVYCFSSTVRLAKSNADMWVPIFSRNRDNVLRVMDTYMEKMKEFRTAIAEGNEDNIRSLIEDANRIKRIIR